MPKRYTEKDISAALHAISDGMTYRDASDKFKIPTTTLCDYRKKTTLHHRRQSRTKKVHSR